MKVHLVDGTYELFRQHFGSANRRGESGREVEMCIRDSVHVVPDTPDTSVRRDPIELAHENWVRSGWADAADGMALVTSIMRVQQLLIGRIEGLLRPYGLTFARFELLRLLAFTRHGVLPVGKIGERLQVHPASVTNAVHRLEQAGLVERRANPADGRGVLAEITAAGRDLVERCTTLLNDEVFATVPLAGADLDGAATALRTLRRSLGDLQI